MLTNLSQQRNTRYFCSSRTVGSGSSSQQRAIIVSQKRRKRKALPVFVSFDFPSLAEDVMRFYSDSTIEDTSAFRMNKNKEIINEIGIWFRKRQDEINLESEINKRKELGFAPKTGQESEDEKAEEGHSLDSIENMSLIQELKTAYDATQLEPEAVLELKKRSKIGALIKYYIEYALENGSALHEFCTKLEKIDDRFKIWNYLDLDKRRYARSENSDENNDE